MVKYNKIKGKVVEYMVIYNTMFSGCALYKAIIFKIERKY